MEEGLMRVGICLPGGGAKGANQAGMLAALEPYREHVTAVSCASVGGLNGSMWVAGQTDEMLGVWRTLRKRDVYRRFPRLLCPWTPSYFTTAPLAALIDRYVDIPALVRADIDLTIHATHLATGQVERVTPVTHMANYKDWLRAGCSIPVGLEPIEIDGEWWCDGGVADNTPLAPLIDAGCDRILMLHCAKRAEPEPGRRPPYRLRGALDVIDLLMRAGQSWDSRLLEATNEAIRRGAQLPEKRFVELVEVDPAVDIGTLEFDGRKAAKAIEASRAAAARVFDNLDWDEPPMAA